MQQSFKLSFFPFAAIVLLAAGTTSFFTSHEAVTGKDVDSTAVPAPVHIDAYDASGYPISIPCPDPGGGVKVKIGFVTPASPMSQPNRELYNPYEGLPGDMAVGGASGQGTGTGTSVDPGTGFLARKEEDLFLKGHGMDFSITRSYHSELYFYNGRFGAGWEMNIYKMFRGFGSGTANGTTGKEPWKLHYTTGEGQPIRDYESTNAADPNNHWFQAEGMSNWVEYQDASSSESGVESMVLYSSNGLIETFEQLDINEEWFYLTTVKDMAGNRVVYNYSATPLGGPQAWTIDSVVDTANREIRFIFSTDFRLITVEVRMDPSLPVIAQLDYIYNPADVNGVMTLKEVVGAEIATEDSNGNLALVRPTTKYEYWEETGFPDGWLLSKVINGEGQAEAAWTYYSGTRGQVKTQTDRPGGSLRAAREGVHNYDYSGGTTKHTDPDGGVTEYLVGAEFQIDEERIYIDATNYLATKYTYDLTQCSICSWLKIVEYPDGSSTEYQYDLDGKVIAEWSHPIPTSAAPSLVERWLWSDFDPANGLFRSNLLEHELIRDAHPSEDPQNGCTSPSCQQSGNASGHIVNFYTWTPKDPTWEEGALLDHIDYGAIDTTVSGSPLTRSEYFDYHPTGILKNHHQIEGGTEVVRIEYGISAASGSVIDSETIVDVVNANQWMTTFEVDNQFLNMVKKIDPDGGATVYSWDQKGNLYQVLGDVSSSSGSAKRSTERRFDKANRLVRSTTVGEGGTSQKTTNKYDESGLPFEVEVLDALGISRTSKMVFSKSGLLTEVEDWRGWKEQTLYGYGALHLPLEVKEKYNSASRNVWQAGDGGSSPSLHPGYDSMGRTLSWRNQASWLSYNEYDGHGRISKAYSQTGSNYYDAQAFKYDSRGFLGELEKGAIQGAPSSVQSWQWHQHQVFENNLAGHLLSYSVFENGSSTAGHRSEYIVDGRGRKLQESTFIGAKNGGTPDLVVSDFVYDAKDRVLESRILSNGQGTGPISVKDFEYDEINRSVVQVKFEGDLRYKTTVIFDKLGSISSRDEFEWVNGSWTAPRTWSYEYDGLSRLVAEENPLGVRNEWSLDGLGRVTEERTVSNNSTGTLATHYQYDAANGTLTSVVDAEGKQTLYNYDPSGWLYQTKVTYPDLRTDEVLSFDNLGRPAITKDGRGVAHYLTYDFKNLISDNVVKPVGSLIPGADSIGWEYDHWKGTPTKSQVIENGNVIWETQFNFNDLGELVSETQGLGNQAASWAWERGYAGELRNVSFPSGLGIEQGIFEYDGAGRVSRAHYMVGASSIADYSFDYEGSKVVGKTDAISGISSNSEYDGYGRMTKLDWTHLVNGAITELDGQERVFDLADRVTSRQRALESAGQVLVHDGFGRMEFFYDEVPAANTVTPNTAPTSFGEVTQYTLNNVYGRTTTGTGFNLGALTVTGYTSNDAHFYTQVGTESRTSVAGYLNSDADYYYRYDAWGRLVEVEEKASPFTVVRKHTYDAGGRRVRTVEEEAGVSVSKRFHFWGLRLAAEWTETSGSPSDVRTYGYTGGRDGEAFVVDGNSGQSYELARDFQGSIIGLVDRATNVVVERYRYSPFGEVSIEDDLDNPLAESAFGNTRFFLGKPYDSLLGIYDLRNRWYDPKLGAFLSPDPLLAYDSWNMYQYGLAAPGTWSDPMGLGVVAYVGGFAVGIGSGAWGIVSALGGTLWDFTWHPIKSYNEAAGGIKVLKDALFAGEFYELADILSGGLIERFETWDNLSDYEQGKLFGETAVALGATVVTVAGLGKLTKKIKRARKLAKKKKKKKKCETGGQAPEVKSGKGKSKLKGGDPNSIYEQLNAKGDKVLSRTFYDEQGRWINRQDFQSGHGFKGAHEHPTGYNEDGFNTKIPPTGLSDGWNSNPLGD